MDFRTEISLEELRFPSISPSAASGIDKRHQRRLRRVMGHAQGLGEARAAIMVKIPCGGHQGRDRHQNGLALIRSSVSCSPRSKQRRRGCHLEPTVGHRF